MHIAGWTTFQRAVKRWNIALSSFTCVQIWYESIENQQHAVLCCTPGMTSTAGYKTPETTKKKE